MESVADHSHRMSLMALLACSGGSLGLDQGRCVKLAVVHDLAEALVGDLTPHCGVSKERKHELEAEALQRMCEALGGASAASEELRALWEEYEAGEVRA